MRMVLFLLLNAVLFVRPEDLWPTIAGLRIYLVTILICMLVNADRLAFALSAPSLTRRPIDVCVLGMWLAIVLSALVRLNFDLAVDWCGEFGKVVVYYFLFKVTLDTPQRFRMFLGWAVALTAAAITAPLLNFYDIVTFDAIDIVSQSYNDRVSGETITIYRLAGIGIFGDPNDLCLLLVFGGMCCCYRAATCTGWVGSILWLLPLIPFGHAFVLTQSRGGILGLLAGMAGVILARFGWVRAAPLVAICAPALVFAIGGRQSDIDAGDTAHERVMLWATGLGAWLGNPFFWLTGIGIDEFIEICPQVAHNSFVHAYVEVGLFGGGMLFAAFYLGGTGLWRAGRDLRCGAPTPFTVALPYVFGLLTGYAAGAFSLSRSYVLPTYLTLAVSQTYLSLAQPVPVPGDLVNTRWIKKFAMIAIGGAAFVKFSTQILGVLNG